jgi:hypothetical protein
LSATTFGPSLIVAAVHGTEALPSWSRWLLGATGVVAMGVGLHALLSEPEVGVGGLASRLAKATEHEMEHTKDPSVAMQIALDHLKKDPDYYVKLERAGL